MESVDLLKKPINAFSAVKVKDMVLNVIFELQKNRQKMQASVIRKN
jgi:hypothetical protein